MRRCVRRRKEEDERLADWRRQLKDQLRRQRGHRKHSQGARCEPRAWGCSRFATVSAHIMMTLFDESPPSPPLVFEVQRESRLNRLLCRISCCGNEVVSIASSLGGRTSRHLVEGYCSEVRVVTSEWRPLPCAAAGFCQGVPPLVFSK